MRIFGFEIGRAKAALGGLPIPVNPSFFGVIRESFAGAWQRNIEVENRTNLLAFSAVYACVSLISEDISKLRWRLMERLENSAVWTEVMRDTPYARVLKKPNPYQTRIQFIAQWILSKLLYGNTYVLKRRSTAHGIVTEMYVLDPRRVTPLVTVDGEVWYRIGSDDLNNTRDEITVPASEVIHDRGPTLFHPLVGVSPIYACGGSATVGLRIQANSERFFKNNSAPSGHLTATGTINDVTAARLKAQFEKDFSAENFGRLLVTGDGLKYEKFTIPAVDAQLIEQLRWTVEDVARCFRVPLHKIGVGQNPTFNNISALNQDYYSQTLQSYIEAMELLLDEGLELKTAQGKVYSIEFDLDGLLRMDPVSMMDVMQKGVGAGILKPNEARARVNLEPVNGGDTPYMQEQNWALAALASREMPKPADPIPALPAPAPNTAPDPEDSTDPEPATDPEEADDPNKAFMDALVKRLQEETRTVLGAE